MKPNRLSIIWIMTLTLLTIDVGIALADDAVIERAVPPSPPMPGTKSGAVAGGGSLGAGGAAVSGAPAGTGASPGLAGAGKSVMGVTALEQQILVLQGQVNTLQAQVAALMSVLQVTQTGTTLHAPVLTLSSPNEITIQSGKGITINAATGIAMKSQTGTSIKTAGPALVESMGVLDLKGNAIKLNGGAKPLATVGSAVGDGRILTGSPTILGN